MAALTQMIPCRFKWRK